MKKTVILFVIFAQSLFAQRAANPFLMRSALLRQNDSLAYTDAFDARLMPLPADKSFLSGAMLAGSFQSGAVSVDDNYNDPLHYLIAPFLQYRANENLSFDVRVNFENIRTDYIFPKRSYWGDEFVRHRGAFDVAVVRYQSKHFSARLGRDYKMPGLYFNEGLLFSRRQYSHDLLEAAYKNRYVRISSYYLSPTTLRTDSMTYQRHINGHRISVHLPWGYVAFNDLMLYGGVNKAMDIMAANPFILLYPYRKNKKHLDGNNLMSLEIYLHRHDYYVFLEALLDDWQADHKVPTDLEPTEWGMNLTFGKKHLFPDVEWKINYTRIANRTYNVETNPWEKYLSKNYPIGHWLGNNFWLLRTSLIYRRQQRWLTDLTLLFLQYGDEAVYGAFNTDYENYTVARGYTEKFPFGKVKTQAGFTINTFYSISDNLLVRGRMGYWFKNSRLKKNFNAGIALAYRIVYSSK